MTGDLKTNAAIPTIKWSELGDILGRIAASYRERGIDHMIAPGDLYLQIAPNDMFDVYSEPSKPWPIGSLVDDWHELKLLINQPEPFATAVDVERLGNVLRALSEAISPTPRTENGAVRQAR